MSEDWDFYLCNVEDKLASMYLDLGAAASAPIPGVAYMAYVRLRMNSPREDGMSSQDEYDALIRIEDDLTKQLVDDRTIYVGRCTTNGFRDFVFYVTRIDDWTSRVSECMRSFTEYTYEADSREDRDWSTYLSYLYPNEIQRETIQNRRVCDALEGQGDKLIDAREIDHWAYFSDASCRNAFVEDAVRLGFAVRSLIESEQGENRYGAQLWRSDVPSLDAIDDITLPLFKLAAKFGGEYDGWESMLVTECD